MGIYDRTPPNIGRSRSDYALTVRRERPASYLIADIASPLVVAAIWLAVPFDVSTANRWIGAVALALIGPVDVLMRRLLSARWANFGPIVMRCCVAIALAAAVPDVWYAGAIVLTGLSMGALAVESIPRVSALTVLAAIGLSVTGVRHDIDTWLLSVAIMVVVLAAHALWYRAWSVEKSDVDLRHGEMVDRALMFSWEVDAATGTVLSLVGNVEGVLGWNARELVGENIARIVDVETEREILRGELSGRASERHATVTATHKDGRTVTMREVRLASRRTGVVRGVSIDISELAQATEALRHQAEHDELTDLANRAVVKSVVETALAHQTGEGLALLVADLDRFKEINDTLGHPTGDRVLRILANRFAAELSDLAVIARLGGDEFAFVATGEFDVERAAELARRVHDLATAPVEVDGLELAVACSVGISIAPDHGTTWPDLLKRADIATYQAKRAGGGIRIFESTPDDLSVQRLQLISETPGALDRGEFELHFQPQVDLATGHIMGVEGLARWRHPQYGLLAPGVFFHAIEVAADYHRFTNEMLRQAVAFSADANAAGHRLQVAVNLGSMSFLDQRLPATIADLLETHGVAPDSLTLEVIESNLLDDQTGDGPVFSALDALGVRLSIDDFGTGYSTFTRLRSLNVDEVKIDRAFVSGLGDSEEDAIIVRTTIQLAQLLGHDVVAEGVETLEQLTWLQRFGCASAQGFLWSPAVHRDDMLDQLDTGEPFPIGDAAAIHNGHALDVVVDGSLLRHANDASVAAAVTNLFDRLALTNADEGVVVRDLTGRLVDANDAFQRMVGAELFRSLVGTRDDDFAHGANGGDFVGDGFAVSTAEATNGRRALVVQLQDRELVLRPENRRLVDAAGHVIGSVSIQHMEQ